MIPFIRSPFNYDVKEASDATAIPTVGASLTVQSQSEDADINVMMKRFGVTGKFPDNPLVPQYGDFSQIRDFRSAWEACAVAAEAFMQYPADFRARFDNDPQLFLDFSADPANIPEMKKLGLFKPEVKNVEPVPANNGGGAQARSEGGASGGSAPPQPVSAAGGNHPGDRSGGPAGQAGPAPAVR